MHKMHIFEIVCGNIAYISVIYNLFGFPTRFTLVPDLV